MSADGTVSMQSAPHLSLTVIVCTKDRPEELGTLVQSLLAQRRLPDELVVVDAGSQPNVGTHLVARIDGRVPLVYLRTTPGLTRQRNLGIASSQGDAVMFLDDDVELDERYVSEVAGLLENDVSQSFGAVQGRVIDCPRGKASTVNTARDWRRVSGQALERVFLLPCYGDGRLKRSGFPARASQSQPSYVQVLSGGCMCFRRRVLDDVHFDEKLTGYGWMEDVDISRQLQEKGHRIFYWPAARIVHRHSSSSRTPLVAMGRMMAHNHHYLYHKYSDSSLGGWLAFWWSLLGLVVYAAGKGEWNRVLGLLIGLQDVLLRRNPLVEDAP